MAEQWPGDSPAAWIDDIGHAIAERYRRIEDALRETLERLADQHLEAPDDTLARYRAIQHLREQAGRLVHTVDPDELARWATAEAAMGASAEISRVLLGFPAYAPSSVSALTAGGAYAVAAVELDLRDALRALNARILRAPADAYQAMTSKHVGSLLAGMTTSQALHRRILDEYLADGITGFTDKGGRRWTIGAYSEMATRSAAARAWRDQSVASMASAGITTLTPVIGSSACSPCAQWAGKILTDGGPTGWVTVPHAVTAEPTQIYVHGTLDEWRASGAGHPNCRDTWIPGLPGGTDASKLTTHDPQKQADREELRRLEREVRAAKRDGDLDEIGEAQAALREHVEKTGIIRREYREQLPFADGGEKNPRGRTIPTDTAPRSRGPQIRISDDHLSRRLAHARGSIRGVHAFPEDVAGPRVLLGDLGPGVQGVYRPARNTITMSGNATHPQLTFAHEYGHHLDHVFGGSNLATRSKEPDPLLRNWQWSVRSTPEYSALQALRADRDLPQDARQYARYLLDDTELWARSYAQFIATRSGNRSMQRAIRSNLEDTNPFAKNRQWSRDGFEPVADAIEAILRERGLM